MRRVILCTLLVVLAQPPAALTQETETVPDLPREAWQARIDEARTRADSQRAALKAEFERKRIELQRHPPSAEDFDRERAKDASEQVKRDSSLQKGDIVSTDNGLFVFIGDPDGEHAPADFVPLPK